MAFDSDDCTGALADRPWLADRMDRGTEDCTGPVAAQSLWPSATLGAEREMIAAYAGETRRVREFSVQIGVRCRDLDCAEVP